MLNCERCKKPSYSVSMSWFNTEVICGECSQAEDKHPDVFAAKQAEHEEVMKGNYNFKGVGLPDDLNPNLPPDEPVDEEPALIPSEECGTDYTLKEDRSCWITVDNVSVYIHRTDEGVIVDMFRLGAEMDESISSAFVFNNEVEGGDDDTV